MSDGPDKAFPPPGAVKAPAAARRALPAAHAPFLHAPEASRSIFLVIFAAACVPLAAGVYFFGWRALIVAALSVGGCMATEGAYYRLTRTPSLMGRSHAALTGLLLALTLPPFVAWYVPLVGALFAILVGKALFGGVGHFLWQPALVGRLAVTVIFPTVVAASSWPVLAPNRAIYGDVNDAIVADVNRPWRQTAAPRDAAAFSRPRPRDLLRQLTLPQAEEPPPESILAVLGRLPPAGDLLVGAYGGGIGETCALAIIVVGLYLVYRNYVHGFVPGLMILAAAIVAAVGPVRTAAGAYQWLPITAQGFDVGFTYVAYQLAAGELMLAAWLLATEMTSRPVTPPGQVIYALLCGSLGMILRLYTDLPIPIYMAVLVCNTLTPLLDGLRPRVLGRRRWWQGPARLGRAS